MFNLNELRSILPGGMFIDIRKENDERLCYSTSPTIIPYQYRDKEVSSVEQKDDTIVIHIKD